MRNEKEQGEETSRIQEEEAGGLAMVRKKGEGSGGGKEEEAEEEEAAGQKDLCDVLRCGEPCDLDAVDASVDTFDHLPTVQEETNLTRRYESRAEKTRRTVGREVEEEGRQRRGKSGKRCTEERRIGRSRSGRRRRGEQEKETS